MRSPRRAPRGPIAGRGSASSRWALAFGARRAGVRPPGGPCPCSRSPSRLAERASVRHRGRPAGCRLRAQRRGHGRRASCSRPGPGSPSARRWDTRWPGPGTCRASSCRSTSRSEFGAVAAAVLVSRLLGGGVVGAAPASPPSRCSTSLVVAIPISATSGVRYHRVLVTMSPLGVIHTAGNASVGAARRVAGRSTRRWACSAWSCRSACCGGPTSSRPAAPRRRSSTRSWPAARSGSAARSTPRRRSSSTAAARLFGAAEVEMLLRHPDGLLRYVGDERGRQRPAAGRRRRVRRAVGAARARRPRRAGRPRRRPALLLRGPRRPGAPAGRPGRAPPGAVGAVQPRRRPAGRACWSGRRSPGCRWPSCPPGTMRRSVAPRRTGRPTGCSATSVRRPCRPSPCCASPRTGCPGW